MKTNKARTKLTFGDFIRWAYAAYGKRKARGIVTLAVNARLVEFRGPQRIEISEQDQRSNPLPMKSVKHIQSEASCSIGHEKRPEPHRLVRLSPRDLLCSFTSVLTEREKMVLHWLAEGLEAREIAERLRRMFPMAIEACAKAAGAARSLSLSPPPSRMSDHGQVPAQTTSRSLPLRQLDASICGSSLSTEQFQSDESHSQMTNNDRA